jgi:hypothetical protein
MTISTNDTNVNAVNKSTGKAMNEALFPFKLHAMLEDAEKHGSEHIVSWLATGNAFIVRKVPEFVTQILPNWFKQTKYKSFQRQLNLWGFERVQSGPDKGAYFHPQFLRDNPDLCQHLTRQRAKKTSPPNGSTTILSSAVSSTARSAAKKAPKARSAMTHSRPMVVPSAAMAGSNNNNNKNNEASLPFASSLMPRQVSESSLESFGELFRQLDTNVDSSTLDLAEFEGFTFHLLEQERYEELNMEFKFTENAGHAQAQEAAASQRAKSQEEEEENACAHTLLQELEQGTFGTPKTSFEVNSMGRNASLCAA